MPNKNSYFCLALPDETEAELVRLAEMMESDAERCLGSPVSFRAMERDAVHVTALFCGEALAQLDTASLTSFYQQFLSAAQRVAATQSHLKFVGYDFFPPEKKNLVIARFVASTELQAFRDEVARIACIAGLAEADRLDPDEAWMPHATLGKIGATKADLGRLRIKLPDPCLAQHGDGRVVACLGLRLAGETPKRKWFDWDTALAFPTTGVSAEEDGAPADPSGELVDVPETGATSSNTGQNDDASAGVAQR